jgi:mono/diheme cytochrome c family protein
MGLIARAHGYGRRCGRNLLSREGCVHCHTVKLSDGGVMKATDDPPSLSHIADKTTREWVYAWLKDPQAYSTTSTMPNFKLGDDDARDISAFLIANSTPVPGDTATLAAKASADPAAGASLYGESFCASCHAVDFSWPKPIPTCWPTCISKPQRSPRTSLPNSAGSAANP